MPFGVFPRRARSSTTGSPWRSLRHPSMRLWTAANLVSNAGTWMQLVAQNLLILQLTGSVLITGLSLSAQAAPGLLLGVVGGAVADKFPLRRVAAVGVVLLAGIAFATAALAFSGLLTAGVVIALGVLSGIVATAEGPATSLLGNDLVPRRDVASAIAVGSIASNVGRLAGTALAGVAVASAGIGAAYVANGISFLVVAAAIPFLRPAPRLEVVGATQAGEAPGDPAEGGVRAGLRYLARDRALVLLLVVGLVTSLLGRHYTTSMAALVSGPLEAGATAYGQVGIALAVGGILGGLFAGRLHRPGLVVVLALAGGTSALQAVVGLSPTLLAVLLLAAPMAAAEGALVTATDTMVQTIPPDRLRGRVLGAWRTASTGLGLAGPLTLGALLEVLGPRAGLVVGGTTSLLLLAVVGVVTRRRHPLTDPAPIPAEAVARAVPAAA